MARKPAEDGRRSVFLLHRQLKEAAAADRRSLNSEVLLLLEYGLAAARGAPLKPAAGLPVVPWTEER